MTVFILTHTRSFMPRLTVFVLLIIAAACQSERKTTNSDSKNTITLITTNAPSSNKHYLSQDTLGKVLTDSAGPYSYHTKLGFTYLDVNKQEQLWKPIPHKRDTLTIPVHSSFLELSYPNPYLSSPQTFIAYAGDTLVFDFKHNLPLATSSNKQQSDFSLNYDQYRLKELYKNSYSPFMIMINVLKENRKKSGDLNQLTLEAYDRSKIAFQKELLWIDSLHTYGQLSNEETDYRKSVLRATHESNRTSIKSISESINQSKGDGELSQAPHYDLKKSDSLLRFQHFRTYMKMKSRYNLPYNQVNYYNESGVSFIDHRAQIDSIISDSSLDSNLKNYLFVDAYKGVMEHYSLSDQKSVLKKLEAYGGDSLVNQLKEKLGLPSYFSDNLGLVDIHQDTTTLAEVLNNNKGNVILLHFWASWCKPCIKSIPAYQEFRKGLSGKNIQFLDIAINDNEKVWKRMLDKHPLDKSSNLFAYNSKSSYKLEELNIKTVPHFMIIDKEGQIVIEKAPKDFNLLRKELLKVLASQ